MTARNVHLAKFKYPGIGTKAGYYQPNRFSWIGDDRSNSSDQVSHRVFKPGVVSGSDHFLSGRPRGDSKPDDRYPSYGLQHSFSPLSVRKSLFSIISRGGLCVGWIALIPPQRLVHASATKGAQVCRVAGLYVTHEDNLCRVVARRPLARWMLPVQQRM